MDLTEVQHKPLPARSPAGPQAVIASMKAKIETLQAEITRLEATKSGHRADFERERDRAERLMSGVLKATADTMAAKEATAWLEGELTALRSRPDALQAEIAQVAATAIDLRADFERDRAERLVAEVLKATAEMIQANDGIARRRVSSSAVKTLVAPNGWLNRPALASQRPHRKRSPEPPARRS